MDRRTPTVSELVRRAVEACDPEGENRALGRFEAQLEDDDAPVTAVADLDERLALAAEGADFAVDDASVAVATALVRYMAAHEPKAGHDREPERLIRPAIEAQWGNSPPAYVADWLAGA